MMSIKRILTDSDFCKAAGELGCEARFIKAVTQVEAPKGAFYDDDFPTILFERHVFWQAAPRDKRQGWFQSHPTICNPTPTPRGGYGNAAAQRVKFAQATALDADAAMEACSWGMFQELGTNYEDVGFDKVSDFVDAMKSGADAHLEIFVASIKHRHLERAMRDKDAAAFAYGYNGRGYRKFQYDSSIEDAYDKLDDIDCSQYSAVPEVVTEATTNIAPATEPATQPPTILDSITAKADAAGDTVQSVETIASKFSGTGTKTVVASLKAGGTVSMILAWFTNNWIWIAAFVVLFIVGAVIWHLSRERHK